MTSIMMNQSLEGQFLHWRQAHGEKARGTSKTDEGVARSGLALTA